MEMEKRTILKDNLKTLYDIEIWMLGCLVLALVPFANVLVIIAAPILAIIGVVAQVRLRKVHPDYQKAVVALVVGFLFNLLGRGEGSLASVMEMVGTIASTAQTYFIIQATNSLLTEVGGMEEVELGKKAWMWTLYSMIGSAVVTLLGFAGSSPLLLLPVIISLIISITALVFYIKYLKRSSEAF